MMRLKPILYFVAALALATHAVAARAAIIPPSGKLDFSVIRDGEKIGTHVLSFRQDKDRLEVDIRTRIAVKVAFITVYRFEQDGHEVWKGGKLVRMQTKTHDDGTDHTLRVSTNGAGRLRVVGDGRESEAAPNAVPASLWNPAFIRTHALMNSLVGTPLDFKVVYKGEENVTVKGKPVRARHYSLTGEMPRELWYDRNWVLVRMTLKGKDGSPVQYLLN